MESAVGKFPASAVVDGDATGVAEADGSTGELGSLLGVGAGASVQPASVSASDKTRMIPKSLGTGSIYGIRPGLDGSHPS